jgi:hypothetical protein
MTGAVWFIFRCGFFLHSPRAQEPKSPRAQEPKSPRAQEPKSPRAQDPHSSQPSTLTAFESPRSSMRTVLIA